MAELVADPPAPQTVLLTVAYDGQPYSGFAIQQNAHTVAGELLTAIRHFDPDVAKLNVASRTDAGVHARAQKVAFDTTRSLPMRAWVLGLAKRLPASVVVREAMVAPLGFNPRYHCALKRYRYLLLRDRLDDPFLVGRVWRVGSLTEEAQVATLRAELGLARGTHDFAAFASARDERPHTERSLVDLAVTEVDTDHRLLAIDITGDGFLHHMVRILVGTVVDVGRGRLEPGAMTRALESRDRRAAGVTAPPDGLYLEQIMLRKEPVGDRWPERR
ncbi:MAG: tRNA pseudouridine(38-40) synthase TruA [Deltaproteobacteria bacterium]|nr:tRNA pseudouridine(38-40) synthase TruA [Deltaproteobacteria bacterium]